MSKIDSAPPDFPSVLRRLYWMQPAAMNAAEAKEWHPPLFPLSAPPPLISLLAAAFCILTKKLPTGEKVFAFDNLEREREQLLGQLCFLIAVASQFARRKIKQHRFWLVILQTENAVFLIALPQISHIFVRNPVFLCCEEILSLLSPVYFLCASMANSIRSLQSARLCLKQRAFFATQVLFGDENQNFN